ncbi:fatty acid desaturase [Phyllobacterium phragmitis]|uniref:Fatty acid desaturase n=1 Tax=Phyllobacterium phragmitis TaxID=2670329 RepID=A0A2S9IUW7_9HYPH|nr:fatty acid desaturase [Phyllobacterium phragmitis]PRD44301.1 fatty acid desaturase [Phyllobacterium phragmitis]
MNGKSARKRGTRLRREKSFRIEWPTLALIAACYAFWFWAGAFLFPFMPVLALVLMGIAVALHSSLQHEALHGHPTRSAGVNEALVFLPLGLFIPYRRYKQTHLQHHADERLTDPYDDPESYYRALADWQKLPFFLKTILRWNNTLLGRISIGPALMITGFLASEWKNIRADDRQVRSAWLRHLAGLLPVLLILSLALGIPPWLYAVTSAYLGLSLIAFRSYCEHQWSERPDGRTIIVEKSVLAPLFLNNNLHFVHHKQPRAAWYELPALYRAKREEWQRMNEGYVFPNYFEVLRAFALSVKEPVVHPVLRRGQPTALPEAIPDQAFRPRRFRINIHGGATAPIPGEPKYE